MSQCSNFILEGFTKDLSICDKLISFLNNHPHKRPGYVGSADGQPIINPELKDSTEVTVYDEPVIHEYMENISHLIGAYKEKYPACNMFAPWGVTEGINIQHYAPGGGFKVWHSERVMAGGAQSNRHLVFMTYLNDVTDEGGTEFMHQNITVSARKGKTLIWPVDWTHTHRGIVSPTQEKYVLTGWFSYMQV